MTIRFPCGACSQPIEIDEEWASKQAVCPYCHKTITVPAQSTLTDLSSIPMAQPATSDRPGGWPTAPAMVATARHESPNHLAIVAAILAGIAVVLVILFAGVMSGHREELQAVFEEAQRQTESGESWMSAMQNSWGAVAEGEGGLPPNWVMALGMLEMGALLTGFAAFVCSIIACFRPRRRGLAIAALAITCLLPIVACGVMGGMVGSGVMPAKVGNAY